MLKHWRLAALALCLAAGLSSARAEDDRLVVRNHTGEHINRIFLTPSSFERWIPVNLEGDGLGDGQHVKIRLPENWQDHCHYDLMVQYDHGGRPRWRDFDICRIHSVTLFWDRDRQVTRAHFD